MSVIKKYLNIGSMKIRIWILIVATTILFWSCIDKYVDDGERHYETGVVAFNNYEGALYNVVDMFMKVNDLNNFIEYVETNTLADGSNGLEVWQTAETEFFPNYRLRENNGLWYLAASGDTLLVIDTKNTGFNSPDAHWEAYSWAFPDALQMFDRIGGSSWNLTLNNMNFYNQDIYYYEPITYIDTAQLTVIAGDEGELTVGGEMTVFPLSSINSDGEAGTKYVLTGTIEGAIWQEKEYQRGLFTEADYSFTITDNSSGKTEPVAVTITPEGNNERTVEIIYKNDIVTL
jgi:hypothetical protein